MPSPPRRKPPRRPIRGARAACGEAGPRLFRVARRPRDSSAPPTPDSLPSANGRSDFGQAATNDVVQRGGRKTGNRRRLSAHDGRGQVGEDVGARFALLGLQLFRRHVLNGAGVGIFHGDAQGRAPPAAAASAGTRIFARPKSTTFTPDFVTTNSTGFRLPWMMLFSCAASSASATWMAYCSV